MTRDLVFQKRLNDSLLQQLRQLKPITDKLNNEIFWSSTFAIKN